jgi:hypothetical protein
MTQEELHHYRSNKQTVYFITCFYFEDAQNIRTRTTGFFLNKDLAQHIIEHNFDDIHEDNFEFAVIEEFEEGLYICPKKHTYYKWVKDKYVPMKSSPKKVKAYFKFLYEKYATVEQYARIG